jgi:crotonobetainyl-CoA:carnitine CoA-transferase CaiB-like acyl-CoA transferase
VARQGMTLSAHERLSLRPAPAIGEHTEYVLMDWLEYTAVQMQALRQQGIFAAAARA